MNLRGPQALRGRLKKTSLRYPSVEKPMERRHNPIFRSLNRLLTLMGAERKLLVFALMMDAGVFNLLHTFFGGILTLCSLYAFARWATRDQPSDASARPQFRQAPRAV